MPTPTHGEVFAKLIEDLAHAQEGLAMLGHLERANAHNKKGVALADGWLACSEMVKRLNYQIIKLGQGKLQ